MSIPYERRSNRNGDLAFAIVMLASYVMMVTSRAVTGWQSMLLVFLLELIYLLFGTIGQRRMISSAFPLACPLYFLLELSLGAVIIYIGQGSPWLLLLPVASQAIQLLPRLWAWLVCLIIWLIDIAPVVWVGRWDQVFSGGLALLAAIVFVAVFTQLTVSEQESRRELSAANQKLREYAVKVEELATTQERNRLAREIHDGLGHYLTSINIQLKAAQAVLRQDISQASEALANAQTLTEEALADVRRSITALRADPATNKPLAELLSMLVQESRSAGVDTNLQIQGDPRPLSAQVEFTLFRVAQEGLTNVRKHAQASQAEIILDYTDCGAARPRIGLTIRDNGLGSEPASTGGYGLTGLQERVQLMGGYLQTETTPGQGFSLRADLPV